MKRWILAGVGLCLAVSQAWALPSSGRLFQAKYGYRPACDACHKDGGGSPVNDYGKAFLQAGRGGAAFDQIAGVDSDGDGTPNGDEIKAKANPGSAKSTPKEPGNWLANVDQIFLPKKDLDQLFPGTEEYKAMEGRLDEGQVKDAESKGIQFLEDDTVPTFYFPVQNNKRVGVAQIVPVKFKDKQLYLGVAVNKEGAIAKVIPLNAKDLPEASSLPVYESLVGKKELESPANLDSWEAQVINGAKRALVTIQIVFSKK